MQCARGLLGLLCGPSLLLSAQAGSPPWLQERLARAQDNAGSIRRAWRQVEDEHRESLAFLLAHMPDRDLRALSAEFLLGQLQLAHDVRARVAWSAQVPEALFCRYVLPYAQANEAREDWRTALAARFVPLVEGCRTPGEVARKLNETIFEALGVRYSTNRNRPDQAPSESIEQGRASCTGLSILLADACRACAVPARLVSVRWPHRRGNHSWVEIWDGSAWRFVGAGEPDPQGLDRAWFVGDAARCEGAERPNRIWAVSFASTGERFTAGWGRNIELWGVDVTARYASDQVTGSAPVADRAGDTAAAVCGQRWSPWT